MEAVIPLSSDIIYSRIANISSNILKQVMEGLAATPVRFCMQLDKTADASQCNQVPVLCLLSEHWGHHSGMPILRAPFGDYKVCWHLQNGEKCLCQTNFRGGKNLGALLASWSTCDAWQHVRFGCFGEETPHITMTCWHALASKILPSIQEEVLFTVLAGAVPGCCPGRSAQATDPALTTCLQHLEPAQGWLYWLNHR